MLRGSSRLLRNLVNILHEYESCMVSYGKQGLVNVVMPCHIDSKVVWFPTRVGPTVFEGGEVGSHIRL